MMKKQKDSPAIQLLQLVWSNCNTTTGHSWERVNQSMASALHLAICSGFKFDVGDFAAINLLFRFGYWGGAWGGGFAEQFYTSAVAADNLSAAQSFEAWKKRKPIIADKVRHGDSRFRHSDSSRAKGRLCISCKFTWKGESVTVTSMAEGETKATACSYKPDTGYSSKGGGCLKILHRYTITPEAIIADRDERKERIAIKERAIKLPNIDKFTKRLGIKTMRDFACISIEKLRKAIEAEEKQQKVAQ